MRKSAGIIVVAATLFAGGLHAADDENTKEIAHARSGAWSAVATVDTFDDSEIAWSAVHPHGDHGKVAVTCEDNGSTLVGSLKAHASNPFIDSIGSVMLQREAIRVRVKVDDTPIIEARGRYPNALTTTNEELVAIVGRMLSGKEARIRTEHGEEQHTFTLSLDGFGDSVKWALTKCGFAFGANEEG